MQTRTDATTLASRIPPDWTVRWLRSPWLSWLHGCCVFSGDTLLGVAWSVDRGHAATRALGEAFERAALRAAPVVCAIGSAAELGPAAFDLAKVLTFDPAQLRDPALAAYRWTPATVTSWVAGTSPRSGADGAGVDGPPVLVPADLAYLRVAGCDPIRIRPASSTGTALATGWAAAQAAAVAELVERHELAVAVAGGLPATGVTATGHDVEELIDRLRRDGVRVRLGLVSRRHGLFTVIAVITSEPTGGSRPALATGSAARRCPTLATRSAVLEALGSWHLAGQAARRFPSAGPVPRDAVRRAAWWALPARAAQVSDLVSDTSASMACQCDRADEPPDVLDALLSAGHPVAVLDLTPPVLTTDGYRVARVVAPDLAMLHADERYPLTTAVAARFPERMTTRPFTPHPFV